MTLFFDSIFNGQIPLWSPEINGGEPLWTATETHPTLDPVALILWLVCFLVGKDVAISYQWTCFLWMFVFSLGGVKCSQWLTKNQWVQFTVFFVLFLGPIATSLPGQSQGCLLPFRYTPWVIHAFLKFDKIPSWKSACLLGICVALSGSGYQTGYSFFFLLLFIGSYLVWKNSFGVRTTMRHLKMALIVIVVAVLGLLPTIVAGFRMMDLAPIARVFYSDGFSLEPAEFFRELFDLSFNSPDWQGSFTMGWVLLPFCLLGLLSCVVGILPSKKRSRRRLFPRAIEVSWAFSLIGSVLISFHSGSFLMLRNWGFMRTMTILASTQIFVIGVNWMFQVFPRKKFGVQWISFVIMILALTYVALDSVRRQSFRYRYPSLASRIPKISSHHLKRPVEKRLKFGFQKWFPYHYQGPAVHHEPSLVFQPLLGLRELNKTNYKLADTVHLNYRKLGDIRVLKTLSAMTHQFQLKRYNKTIFSNLSVEKLKLIFGVESPIVNVVHTAYPSNNLVESIDWLISREGSEELKKMAVVEGDIPMGLNQRSSSQLNLDYIEPESYGPNHYKLRTKSETVGLLIFKDNYSPFWKVFVDGEERELLIANAVNKAVYLPAGSHTVEFKYRPNLYIFAFWIRAVLLLGALGWCLASIRVTSPSEKKILVWSSGET